jgi:hypothetical protein
MDNIINELAPFMINVRAPRIVAATPPPPLPPVHAPRIVAATPPPPLPPVHAPRIVAATTPPPLPPVRAPRIVAATPPPQQQEYKLTVEFQSQPQKETSDHYLGNQMSDDVLFMYYRILAKGECAYETWKLKSLCKGGGGIDFHEKPLKFALIEELRNPANKHLWDRTTRATTLTEIEADLTVAKRINIFTFITLCKLHVTCSFDIIYKNAKYHFEGESDDDTATTPAASGSVGTFPCIKYCKGKGHKTPHKWIMDTCTPTTMHTAPSPYIIEKLHKPYRAISSYKVGDLSELCTKLNIETGTDTKPQLYEKIKTYFEDLS